MRLAVVVGHNSTRQGAVRQDTGESEFVWNGRLAPLIRRPYGRPWTGRGPGSAARGNPYEEGD